MTAASERRVEELAFLRALGAAMASDLAAHKTLSRAVDLCFVRFELGALVALHADGGTFHLSAAHGLPAQARERLARITDRELGALLGCPVGLSEKIVVSQDCRLLSHDGETTPRSALFAPLVHARRRLGALIVIAHPGERLGDDALATWDPIVSSISVALRASDDFERVVALEAEKRQLVDNLPVIVARYDLGAGAFTFANGAIQRILGMRPTDALGSPGMDAALLDSVEREASHAARRRATAGSPAIWEDRRYRHADGRVLTLRECVYPVFDATHDMRAVEILAYDITTEVEARKELIRVDRLTSLGALAGSLAHEINNPIAFIMLAAGQIEKAAVARRPTDPHLGELASEVRGAAQRVADIVGELKLFARGDQGAVSCPVDVNRILQTALALTQAELKRHARLEVHLGELPVAPGTFSNLGHAFVNLLRNAGQAIEAKGERGEHDVVRVTTAVEGGAIVVLIEDTGVGIDARALPRMFEPFFKAGTGGTGTGLGLAIAYDLVRRVGGNIRVESRVSEGARFTVTLPFELPAFELPAVDVPSQPLAQPAPRVDLPRVLIIDDEPGLAKALARQLSSRYDVDTASTAVEAVAQLSVRSYHAVICDLRMPDQSGPQIHDQVRGRSNEQAARFLFVTAGEYDAVDDVVTEQAKRSGVPLLEKPFDLERFEAVVASIVGREGDTLPPP